MFKIVKKMDFRPVEFLKENEEWKPNWEQNEKL